MYISTIAASLPHGLTATALGHCLVRGYVGQLHSSQASCFRHEIPFLLCKGASIRPTVIKLHLVTVYPQRRPKCSAGSRTRLLMTSYISGKGISSIANTGCLELESAGLLDLDRAVCLARARAEALDLRDDVKTVDHLAENDVLTVQPGSSDGGDEELQGGNGCQKPKR